MPVYRNPNRETKSYGGRVFAYNVPEETDFLVPDEIGLELLDEAPKVEPSCLDAGEISMGSGGSLKIVIPDCNTFTASVACLTGKLRVQHNYDDAEKIPVPVGIDYILPCADRKKIGTLIITADGASTGVYNIEKP